MEIANIDWFRTILLAEFIAFSILGLVSGILASLRLRRLDRERRAQDANAYMRRVYQHERATFSDSFD